MLSPRWAHPACRRELSSKSLKQSCFMIPRQPLRLHSTLTASRSMDDFVLDIVTELSAQIPFDKIKIDQSFVRISDTDESIAVVRAVLGRNTRHRHHRDVETADQPDFARRMLVARFLFGQPCLREGGNLRAAASRRRRIVAFAAEHAASETTWLRCLASIKRTPASGELPRRRVSAPAVRQWRKEEILRMTPNARTSSGF